MTPSDALLDTVVASLAQQGLSDDTEVVAGETLIPDSRAPATTWRALSAHGPDRFELRRTLGEGGMGRVRLARQRVLDRDVAVKTVKADQRSERATEDLLREAWVIGSLEHPNVIPVHDILVGDDGEPIVVLKKVDGRDWSSLIADANAVRERFERDDLLEFNIDVLIQVCGAMAFAHEHGIIHRDLKPENVMLGPQGEVYVVDWGLAAALPHGPTERLVAASDVDDLAGTPAYMAPEMVGELGIPLSERTDVYLLGAILFEMVTGAPPHDGATLGAVLRSVLMNSPPELGDDVPSPLRRLVDATMAYDPDERMASASLLRRGLEDFLRHRDAMALADKAERGLEGLIAAANDPSVDPELLYRRFGECRFGFQHAIEVWPGATRARAGLSRAIELMVRYELDHHQPRAASTWLAEHPDPPQPLRDAVEEAVSAKRTEEGRLRRLRDALDPRTGLRQRVRLGLILGVGFIAQPLGTQWMAREGILEATHESMIARNVILMAAILALAWWSRSSLRASLINRQIIVALFGAALSQLVLHVADHIREAPMATTTRTQFIVWGMLTLMIAVSVDAWFLVAAIAHIACFLGLLWWPWAGFYAVALCNLVLVTTLLTLAAGAAPPEHPDA